MRTCVFTESQKNYTTLRGHLHLDSFLALCSFCLLCPRPIFLHFSPFWPFVKTQFASKPPLAFKDQTIHWLLPFMVLLTVRLRTLKQVLEPAPLLKVMAEWIFVPVHSSVCPFPGQKSNSAMNISWCIGAHRAGKISQPSEKANSSSLLGYP